ncbi:hypothetical protein SDC9_147755 [bioreactor metagenome]|uniref:Uncharacterized protein n=1 Tax=bioreactor metagenome TaxID=1076179 RepID=A0A645EHD5_9ZZZZ
MDQTINATQVDEHTVRSDVFNGTFKDLTFLQLADNFFFLIFEFSFDKRFV